VTYFNIDEKKQQLIVTFTEIWNTFVKYFNTT